MTDTDGKGRRKIFLAIVIITVLLLASIGFYVNSLDKTGDVGSSLIAPPTANVPIGGGCGRAEANSNDKVETRISGLESL